MIKFESKKNDEGRYTHKVIVDNVAIDEFENYAETTDLNTYLTDVSFQPKQDLLNALDSEGIFKKYTKMAKADGVYTCKIINKADSIGITEEVVITSKTKVPDTVIIGEHDESDIIMSNAWLNSFSKKIENGFLLKSQDTEDSLVIKLPKNFIEKHFKGSSKDKVINFKRMVNSLVK